MADDVLLEVSDGLATVTLNRPDKLNAYVPEMGDALLRTFRRLRDDDAVRVVILTGAGRAFCAGVDLEALKTSQAGGQTRLGAEEFLTAFPVEVHRFPKPVIAALNGHAIGVGITMALPCDLRVAAEDAKIGLTFAKLGILPGLGSSSLLPGLVGLARAQELVLTAEPVRGREAARIGLVNRAVPADQVLPEARALAEKMLACDPLVLSAAKRVVLRGAGLGLEEALENERTESALLRKQRAARS
ncbi:MAG: enoyl-CoA hydratase/isomerase family protein [Myxococcota bacterium]